MTTPNNAPTDPTSGQPLVTAAPIVAPTTPSQVQPEPVIPPAGGYTLADIERVRQEEKAKLYGRIEEEKQKAKQLAEENARLKTAVPQPQQPAPEASSQELTELKQMTTTMAQQLQTLTNAYTQTEAERYAAELRLYMNDRINAYEQAGYGLVYELIQGNTAQEIEASIQRAAQAWQRYGMGPRVPQQPQQQVQQLPIAIVQQPYQVPNGFPTAPNGAAVPMQDPGNGGLVEDIRALTTPEAVRSGAYAQNRQRIMSALQQQGGAVSGALSNAPRYMPTPGQIPQSTWQGVQQPQARLAPPAAPQPPRAAPVPQYQQQYPQQQYQPQQPYAQPAYPQQQMMQSPQYQQPQYQPQIPNGGPVQPADLNAGAPFDPGAARQQAQQVAQRHLANPAAVPNNATSGAPGKVPGYDNAPNRNASFDQHGGQVINPMIRNN